MNQFTYGVTPFSWFVGVIRGLLERWTDVYLKDNFFEVVVFRWAIYFLLCTIVIIIIIIPMIGVYELCLLGWMLMRCGSHWVGLFFCVSVWGTFA